MKFSKSGLSVALLASSSSAASLDIEHAKRALADNCLRAVRGTPSIGLPFCSSALTIKPVTSTSYAAAPAVTITVSTTTTASTTLTTTTGTETITTSLLAKRRTDPTVNILNQCGNDQARVTSACSQFLSGVPTSTTTILSTTTPTFYTTVSPPAPTNLVVNGDFDETDDIQADWTIFGDYCGSACGTGVIQHNTYKSAPAALQVSLTQQSDIYGGYYSIGQSIRIDNNKLYIFSFSYLAEQEGTSLEIAVECGEYTADPLDATVYPITEWQTYTSGPVSFANTGDDLLEMYLNFEAWSGIGVTDTVYVDDVKLVEA